MKNIHAKSLPLLAMAASLLMINTGIAQTTTTTTTTTNSDGTTATTVQKTTTAADPNTATPSTAPVAQPTAPRRRIVSPVGVTGTIRRSHRRQERRN